MCFACGDEQPNGLHLRVFADHGVAVSIEHYGASAPHTVLFEQFGFTVDKVVAAAHASLAKVGEITGTTTGN